LDIRRNHSLRRENNIRLYAASRKRSEQDRSHDFARLKACCRTSSHRGWINGKTADGLLHVIRRWDLARKTEILAEFEAWQARLNSIAAGKPRGRRGAFGPNFCFSS
jgi:hypothetical protein